MRDQMNMAVKPVNSMDTSTKRPQKPVVQILSPMVWNNQMGGAVASKAMGEVVGFSIRDVPSLNYG